MKYEKKWASPIHCNYLMRFAGNLVKNTIFWSVFNSETNLTKTNKTAIANYISSFFNSSIFFNIPYKATTKYIVRYPDEAPYHISYKIKYFLISLSHQLIEMATFFFQIPVRNHISFCYSIQRLAISTWFWLCIWYITANPNHTP